MAKYFDEITKEQLMSHILSYDTDGCEGEDVEGVDDSEFELVEDGEEQIERKLIYWSNVYRHIPTDTYYAVHGSRSNSGYWRDSERYPSEVNEVKKVVKIVEQVSWEAV